MMASVPDYVMASLIVLGGLVIVAALAFGLARIVSAPTRTEFSGVQSNLHNLELQLPEMEGKILIAIRESEDRTAANIEKVASTAYTGRGKIWTPVKESQLRIARLELLHQMPELMDAPSVAPESEPEIITP